MEAIWSLPPSGGHTKAPRQFWHHRFCCYLCFCMHEGQEFKVFYNFGKALASWSESYPVCRSNTSYDGKHEMGFLAAGNCQSHLFCTTASHKLSHLVENCSNLAKRKLERGREGGGGREGGEDGQRLPRRAWSCNCEKRLLHYLHRTP